MPPMMPHGMMQSHGMQGNPMGVQDPRLAMQRMAQGHNMPSGSAASSGNNLSMVMPHMDGQNYQANAQHHQLPQQGQAIPNIDASKEPADLKRKLEDGTEPAAKKPAKAAADGDAEKKKKPRAKKRKLEEQVLELINIDFDDIRSLPKMRVVAKKLQGYVKAKLQEAEDAKLKEEKSAENDASIISRNVYKAWRQQMIFQPKQKMSASKRLTFSALCTRPAAAILLGEKELTGRKATFQKKMSQNDLWGETLRRDQRHNAFLIVNSDVAVKYSVAKGEVTFSATWSCER